MKKKVLFINGHLNAGGCERSLVDVLMHFDYSKFQVDLLLLEEEGDYINEIPDEVNIYLYSLNNAFGSLTKCMKRALQQKDWFSIWFRSVYLLSTRISMKLLRAGRFLFKDLQKNYDVIIAYRPGICTDMAAYMFVGKQKISWWHHGEMNYTGNMERKLYKAYRRMNKIVAVSECSAELLKKIFPDLIKKIHIIPNMICIDELKEKASRDIPTRVQKDSILNLVSVGRMSPEKNMFFCIEVAKQLKERKVNFYWFIIGDGEQYDEFAKRVSDYGLQGNMQLLGRLSNPYPYVKEADIMVHPSFVESQGITILESMALGTPVIAVKSAGPKEFIISGENGFLVEADTMEVVSAVVKLMINDNLKAKLLKYGQNTVLTYSPKNVMNKIYKILE